MSQAATLDATMEAGGRGLSPHLRLLVDLFATGKPIQIERGCTHFHEKDQADNVVLLHSGMCVAIKPLPNGKQQTVAIYVSGDVLGHEAVSLGVATSSIAAITPASGHRLPIVRLRDALRQNGDLAEAFRHYVAVQGALGHEWLLGLGRRPAFERTAHLLCEVAWRMRAAGQGTDERCEFPVTQTDLSNILGLSVVHMNRTLQRLRQTGYVVFRQGRLEIRDAPRLAALAGFETHYLDIGANA